MSELTKDKNKLMTRYMKFYLNLMILKSTNHKEQMLLDRMKARVAVHNEYMMGFWDEFGTEPEAEG